jgi:hypothetical protein
MPKSFVRDHLAPAHSIAVLDCNITYTNDFVKHPFSPRESVRPVPRVQITGPMQSDTTYSVEYMCAVCGTSPRTCNQGKKRLLKLTMAMASSVETILTMWILRIVVRVFML